MEHNELVEYVGLVKDLMCKEQELEDSYKPIYARIDDWCEEQKEPIKEELRAAQSKTTDAYMEYSGIQEKRHETLWIGPILIDKVFTPWGKAALERESDEAWGRYLEIEHLEDPIKARLAAWDDKKDELMEPYIDKTFELRNELRKQIRALLSTNVIHPKYQNLVAICSIYEYLETGRCETLTGADGAYNLYESEVRQDRIIELLEDINDNLEQIKRNQFVLYQAVTDMNQKIDELGEAICQELEAGHTELLKQAKVNQYFAAVTAFNTSSKEKLATLGGARGLLTEMRLKNF